MSNSYEWYAQDADGFAISSPVQGKPKKREIWQVLRAFPGARVHVTRHGQDGTEQTTTTDTYSLTDSGRLDIESGPLYAEHR